jgi:hypothetical protein
MGRVVRDLRSSVPSTPHTQQTYLQLLAYFYSAAVA